jgi:hypothetical protein
MQAPAASHCAALQSDCVVSVQGVPAATPQDPAEQLSFWHSAAVHSFLGSVPSVALRQPPRPLHTRQAGHSPKGSLSPVSGMFTQAPPRHCWQTPPHSVPSGPADQDSWAADAVQTWQRLLGLGSPSS